MWVLATRSRPDSCKRFIQSWIDTNASTPVYVRLDHCDPLLKQTVDLAWPAQFSISIGQRIGLRGSINEVFEKYPNESWYGILADDLVPRTPNWDTQLINSCGEWGIGYPNDGGDRDWPTHPCVGGELVRAIGWFGFPPCQHYFTDTVWKYIGQELGNIKRLDQILVEHMHHSLGKSQLDLVYQQSIDNWQQDKKAYAQWTKSQGPALIERLKCLL